MPNSSAAVAIAVEDSIERTERLCVTFLQTDIDLAFSYLRLAVAECRLENRVRAVGLIEKTILEYKTVRQQIDQLPVELAEERCQLRERAGKLFEAIVSAENRLHILAG